MDELPPFSYLYKSNIVAGWTPYKPAKLGEHIELCQEHIQNCEDMIKRMQAELVALRSQQRPSLSRDTVFSALENEIDPGRGQHLQPQSQQHRELSWSLSYEDKLSISITMKSLCPCVLEYLRNDVVMV